MKRTTITDIARQLNITPATVSRALSNHPEINNETKKRVRDKAIELDYQPNKAATSLRLGRSRVIGVMIPSVEHPFFGAVIHGISYLATQNDYDLLIYQSNDLQELEEKGIKTFITAGVDGILVSIAKNTFTYSHFEYVKSKNIPIAFFDRIEDNMGIATVSIDDYKGAYLVTKSLLNEGYEKIAHITGPLHMKIFADRLNGYKDALRDHQKKSVSEWVYEGNIGISCGINGTKQFMLLEEKPDAIFAAEDFTALGVIKELKVQNVKVPDEIGVFGFCNEVFGEHISPSLSTVDQQTEAIGEEAFALIHELIKANNKMNEVYRKVLDPILIIRESSKKVMY